MSAKKRVTLYLSKEMLDETKLEASRLDRTISWILQSAWRLSRDELCSAPLPMAKAEKGTWKRGRRDDAADERETG